MLTQSVTTVNYKQV